MPVCYCKNSGGYGRFLQVIEQKPVKPKVEEEQEAEPAKHLTKRKLHQLEPLKPSKRETRVRCAENRLRSLGDSTACCGCGDIPGFEGNPFNCVSVKNGSGAVATEKMRQKGTAYCFKSVHQDAGTSELIKEKSFHEMMQDSAKMFI